MELRAEELRIGNYVNRLGKPRIIKAIQPTDTICYVSAAGEAVTINQLKPIPLTEEIIKNNLGFYIDNHDGVKFISIGRINKAMEIYFVIVGEILVMSIRIDLQFIDLGPRVKHLHQFQNLYKELTMGQELNVKL